MTDPLRTPGTTPRRAEPPLPDRPGTGDDSIDAKESSAASEASPDEDPVAKQLEQSRTALDNVRNP